MKQLIYVTTVALLLTVNAGAEVKMNFGTCSADIKTHCSTSQDDHAKHDCLLKLEESKLSKGCLEHRKGLASKNHEHKSEKHKDHTH